MAQQLASTVLARFATNIDAITSESAASGFVRSGYRFTVDKEPDSAVDGVYFVSMTSVDRQGPQFGASETIWEATVNVDVGYYRGGGDLGGGDRQTVMRNAADDMQRLGDILCNPTNYDIATTGIREVRFQGAAMVAEKAHVEVWRARFWVQWRSDLVTT